MENKFEIQASAKSNINTYNRYPFANYDEAFINLKNKFLQPGEIAVAYYLDDSNMLGINAALAIGNLKRAENIIFKNPDIVQDNLQEILKSVNKQKDVINNMIDNINHSNNNYADIENRLTTAEQLLSKYDKNKIYIIDLDIYEDDLNN